MNINILTVAILTWLLTSTFLIAFNHAAHRYDDDIHVEWLEWNENMKPYKEMYCPEIDRYIMTYYPFFREPTKTYSQPFKENGVTYVYIYDHVNCHQSKVPLEIASEHIIASGKETNGRKNNEV